MEQRGEDVFHVVVVVQNNGFLPTYTSQKALERKIVRPIEIELALPDGVSLVGGERHQEIGQLEGRSNKLWSSFGNNSLTDNLRKVEWVLKGSHGSRVELTVRAQRAGTVRRSIVLE